MSPWRLGLAVGGGCPKGRRAEDGIIPDRYPLTETPEPDDEARTRRNVEDADGTLILNLGELDGGTALDRRPRPPSRQAVSGGGAGGGDRLGGISGLAGREPDRRVERGRPPREPTAGGVRSGGTLFGGAIACRVPARGRPLYTPCALPESGLPHPFTVGA